MDVHRASPHRRGRARRPGARLAGEPQRSRRERHLRDLGEHRLKDLAAAAAGLYQLGADEFPPLRTLHQTNLPVTRDAARSAASARSRTCSSCSAAKTSPVVTLTGAGGSGKTRLVMQAAAEAAEDYADGVWFVGLATLTEVDLVVTGIAQTFGLREGSGRTYRACSATTCARGGCYSCSTISSSCFPKMAGR